MCTWYLQAVAVRNHFCMDINFSNSVLTLYSSLLLLGIGTVYTGKASACDAVTHSCVVVGGLSPYLTVG